MSDLPEINFNEKKERKGFLPWLRARLGFGGQGAMGQASIGAAKIGTVGGGILAGKAGLIVMGLVVSAVVGTTVYMNNQGSMTGSTAAFKSGKTQQDSYIPAILRQSRGGGSSLEMFKATNKGAVNLDENPNAAKKNNETASSKDDQAATAEVEQQASAPQTPDTSSMMEGMMGKLAGGGGASGLSSTTGGGSSSNRITAGGGFTNKATLSANKFGGGPVGAGFQAMPKFDQRKKVLAMKGSARAVVSGNKSAQSAAMGKGSFNQAKGMRATQQSYSGKNIDSGRSTQDQAWSGSTNEGSTEGGAGISEGGAGIVTSPSIDNASDSMAGGGGDYNNDYGGGGQACGPGTKQESGICVIDDTPWKNEQMAIYALVLAAAALAALGAWLVSLGSATAAAFSAGLVLYWLGIVLCGLACLAGAAAIVLGGIVMGQHKQYALGAIGIAGGGVGIAAGIAGMYGDSSKGIGAYSLWLAAATGAIGLIGAMMGK